MKKNWTTWVWLPIMTGFLVAGLAQTPTRWKSHDLTRPHPPRVTPGPQRLPAPPPSDAVVLFDGTDLSQWVGQDGGPAPWKLGDGFMETVREKGSIHTREGFGDVQLHVEWSTPSPPRGVGQDRGNSGVYLMGMYEVQVLDSWENETYADGQAGAVYGQYPPLFNASLPPGEWQAYDIVFRRPRFDLNGLLLQPARLTVFHNGVLVQDSVPLVGPTNWLQPLPYQPQPDQLPLLLQDHDHPVRYRNIWIRRLPEWTPAGPPPESIRPTIEMAEDALQRYVGRYAFEEGGGVATVSREGRQLRVHLFGPLQLDLLAHSPREFSLRWTAARIEFDLGPGGEPTGLTFFIGGEERKAHRIQ